MNGMTTKVAAATQSARQEAERLYTELRGLGDQIRLKLHLANAERRDAWRKLEPQLLTFEQRVARTTETAIDELRSAAKELKLNLERLWSELRTLDS